MAYKTTESTSISTTTRSGKPTTTSTTTTTSKRKLGSKEQAQGLLGLAGQVQMVAITLIVIPMAAAVANFNLVDLQQTNPNYQNANTYIPYEDPMEDIDYQQYGTGVIDSLLDFVDFVTPFAELAQTGWEFLMSIFNIVNYEGVAPGTDDSFVGTFGSSRVLDLSRMSFPLLFDYYEELTEEERQWVLDNVDLQEKTPFEQGLYSTRWYLFVFIDGSLQFFYTEQSVYDYVVELGV